MTLDNIRNLVIGAILFVVVITGGVLFLGTLSSSDATLDSENSVNNFNSTLNKAQEVTTAANGIRDSINSVSENDAGVLGWINALFNSVFRGVKATFSSLGFIGTAMTDTVNLFGFEAAAPMIALVSLIIVIVIGFAIYSFIAGRN